ncbi:MAG: DUF397 domain-containing protein [Dehalococcoidia bacterium]
MPDLSRAVWRKATRSGNSGSCVEVASNLLAEHGAVYVRDSKHPSGPVLTFPAAEWDAFLASVKDRNFDL